MKRVMLKLSIFTLQNPIKTFKIPLKHFSEDEKYVIFCVIFHRFEKQYMFFLDKSIKLKPSISFEFHQDFFISMKYNIMENMNTQI